MNFDEVVDRNNTNCLKYDFKKQRNMPEDVLPMWVADMDFKCADEIIEAMHKKVDHGIFGYSKEDKKYFEAINGWYKRNYNVELKQDWLVTIPNVVFAIATAIKVLTNEKDYILINNPVFGSFAETAHDNKRNIISSDLILKDGHYEIDFDDFEKKIKDYKVKLFILCSPHNPVGRVWTKDELDKIIAICKKYNVYIISDEIHSDFVWKNKQICLLKYTDYQDHIILCTAPAKTFNISGLQIANTFISNKELKDKFQIELWNTGYSLLNIMGLVACQAAYEKGQKWLDEVNKYILDNINFLDKYLKDKLPKIKLIYPEGTFQLWLDFRELNLSDEEINKILINEAKLWLNSGKSYGKTGEGFQRINIAVPKVILKDALERLEKAFKKYQ